MGFLPVRVAPGCGDCRNLVMFKAMVPRTTGSGGRWMDLSLEDPLDGDAKWTDLAPHLSTRALPLWPPFRGQSTLEKESIMIGQGNCTQRIERWMKGVVVGPGAPAGGLRLTLHHAPIDGDSGCYARGTG